MTTAPFRPRALAGGFDLDPDLPAPDPDPFGQLAGLHVLRHLHRFLDSLRLQLVLTGDTYSGLRWNLEGDYDDHVARREFRRYRTAASKSGLRRALRHEPAVVPLFGLSGSSCVGWCEVSWDGTRLDRYLQPGRLIAVLPEFGVMIRRGEQLHELHLLAWQAPFPTHSLVTWTNDARLCDGPQELDQRLRRDIGYMFHTGEPLGLTRGGNRRVEQWWAQAPGRTLAAPREVASR